MIHKSTELIEKTVSKIVSENRWKTKMRKKLFQIDFLRKRNSNPKFRLISNTRNKLGHNGKLQNVSKAKTIDFLGCQKVQSKNGNSFNSLEI